MAFKNLNRNCIFNHNCIFFPKIVLPHHWFQLITTKRYF